MGDCCKSDFGYGGGFFGGDNFWWIIILIILIVCLCPGFFGGRCHDPC